MNFVMCDNCGGTTIPNFSVQGEKGKNLCIIEKKDGKWKPGCHFEHANDFQLSAAKSILASQEINHQ